MKKNISIYLKTIALLFAMMVIAANLAAQTNIALGKTVTAQATTAGAAANIVDGDTATKWQSAAVWSQWVYVDLGTTYNVNRIIARFDSGATATAKGYPVSYNIQVSGDASTWTMIDSVKSNTVAINDRNNLSATARYVKLQLTGRVGTYYIIKELEIYGGYPNIALGKTVTAQATTAGVAGYTVDGDTATKWQSAAIWSQWIDVDLGTTYNVNKIIARFDSNATVKGYPVSYNIQVSNDASTWTTIDSIRSNKVATNTRNVSANGRYIRFQLIGRVGTYYIVKEFEIYGYANANLVTYPLASCFTESETRSVSVVQNGVETTVPVRKFAGHGTTFYDYAQFSFSGAVTVKVKNKTAAVSSYQISPDSYQIPGTIADSVLSFSLPSSRYVQVVLNNQTERPLFIIADSLESNVPPSSGLGIYNVTVAPYSADNTGGNNVTTKIQQAVNDAANAGGGIVFVPAGVFRLSKIIAKSNVNIYLQGGAVLKGLTAAEGATEVRMIDGNGVSNVKVYGRGTIWCNGAAANNNQKTDSTGSKRVTGVRFTGNSGNITIDGITVSESMGWSVAMYAGTNNIVVKNAKIMNATDWFWNDGYDLSGAHHADINHCIYVGCDDASSCKVDPGFPVHHVHYNDMVMKTNSSGFKAGMQAYDSLHDITVENYRIIGSSRAFNFDHWYGTGVWGGNIVVKNFWVDEVHGATAGNLANCNYIDCPFRFVVCNRDDSGLGPIRNIWVENIYYPTGPNKAYLRGNDATNTVSYITFKNCKYNGTPVTSALTGNIQEVAFTNNIVYSDDEMLLGMSVSNFTAVAAGTAAVLQWQALNETAANRFEIQRASDDGIYTSIQTVPGDKDSGTQHTYNYKDLSPVSGNNYYRLVQTDTDNHTNYSEVKKVNFAAHAMATIQASPNPAKGQFTLRYKTNTDAPVSITMYDMLGKPVKKLVNQKVFAKDAENILQCNLANDKMLANGQYLIQMSTTENILGLTKLILSK